MKNDVIDEAEQKFEGTVYMYLDPCSARNFFMHWILAAKDGRHFVIDEWPNRYDVIPGIGMMDAWATPGTGKQFDGKPGPAQDDLGWSLLQYKQEIARVEGWECYKEIAAPEEIKAWDQHGPKRREIMDRFMDARFGNVEALGEGGRRTLFDEFDDIGLTFQETTADGRDTVDDSVVILNSLLAYNTAQPAVDGFNCPKFFITPWCENTIFAFQIWTNMCKDKGACKDALDGPRYHVLKHNEHVEPVDVRKMGGRGCY